MLIGSVRSWRGFYGRVAATARRERHGEERDGGDGGADAHPRIAVAQRQRVLARRQRDAQLPQSGGAGGGGPVVVDRCLPAVVEGDRGDEEGGAWSAIAETYALPLLARQQCCRGVAARPHGAIAEADVGGREIEACQLARGARRILDTAQRAHEAVARQPRAAERQQRERRRRPLRRAQLAQQVAHLAAEDE